MALIAPNSEDFEIDTLRLMQLLPHRPPMLMIEKIINIVPHESATGIKNVSVNEPHFLGHFPGKPIMPGVMIVEAMAQTSAALVVYSLGTTAEGKLVYFMSIEGAKFRKKVIPGDTMYVHVMRERRRSNVWRFRGECRVNGILAAEATYSAMISNFND